MFAYFEGFSQNLRRSPKSHFSTILQSSKAAGVTIITNLVVLGARDQDSENSRGSDQEIGAFELKMILRRVFARENCRNNKKYVTFC